MSSLADTADDLQNELASLLVVKAAWLPAAAAVIMSIAAPIAAASGSLSDEAYFVAAALPTLLVGALIASKQTRNPIGWLLLTAGLLFQLQLIGEAYIAVPENLAASGGSWVAWLTEWLWIIPFAATGIVLPLTFPDGRPLTKRWRLALWATAIAVIGATLSTALLPDVLNDLETQNPAGIDGLYTEIDIVRDCSFGLILACFVSAVISVALRFRRSTGEEQKQVQWLAYVGALIATGFIAGGLVTLSTDPTLQLIGDIGWAIALVGTLVGLPLAIGVAILRYRLYEIEWIINRTLVYVPLTALLAGIYVCLTGIMKTLITEETAATSEFSIALTTIVVVSCLTPAKNYLQERVDRRFKEHPDPATELNKLADESASAAVLLDRRSFARRFLESTCHSLGARGGVLTLERERAPLVTLQGQWDGKAALTVPLIYEGVDVGRLEIDDRENGRAYSGAERQALQRYADAAAHLLSISPP